ncbi:hypothetical protein [Streptomyces sp. NPDC001919]
MASTAKFDQAIRTAQAKLAAVQRREMWALPAREQASLARHQATVLRKALKLTSDARADAAIDTIWTTAAQRLAAEIRENETAKSTAITEAAKAKAARKGWW